MCHRYPLDLLEGARGACILQGVYAQVRSEIPYPVECDQAGSGEDASTASSAFTARTPLTLRHRREQQTKESDGGPGGDDDCEDYADSRPVVLSALMYTAHRKLAIAQKSIAEKTPRKKTR